MNTLKVMYMMWMVSLMLYSSYMVVYTIGLV